MRAITVRQPWAWSIIHGGKDVENRSRNIAGSYRGPLAIHAGLFERDPGWYDRRFLDAFRVVWEAADKLEDLAVVLGGPLVLGAIVGVVDLVDVHESVGEYAVCCASTWADPHAHHLVVANPRPLPEPIPYRGALGLWRLGGYAIEEIDAQLAAAV